MQEPKGKTIPRSRESAFAGRFKELASGCPRLALAETFGVTRKTLWNWAHGVSVPTGDLVGTIARHFNTTTDYLLGLTDDPEPNWTSP